ncbi:alpha-L RNA-binding motif-containing protein [Fistulina hepatica ATCC 64428]|uniref:Alpha-L RNA-binding motif-containing protein n=1 Tax=Fistulina hepatica ATCC 64428 TaxID=1128425 RepID=A0A0D7AK69_9AGAR|nr:alpha-L RNA-binding motif-containing protein [Fistulina hepatica ATCC 64428]
MRDVFIYSPKRCLPRMSWSVKNFYNLWNRSLRRDNFDSGRATLFQCRWKAKRLVRAYHGDYINEKIFKRWYLPESIPDVRPTKPRSDDDTLTKFAQRKGRAQWQRRSAFEMPPVTSLMFANVERRVDTLIFRSCFAPSIYEARRLVIHGHVRLNGLLHRNANTRLAPGDMISVDPEAIKFFRNPADPENWSDASSTAEAAENDAIPETPVQVGDASTSELASSSEVTTTADANADSSSVHDLTPFWLPHYASPHIFIPAYIEPNFATCSAIYVRHPTASPGYSEIPTPYEADGAVMRYAWEWYVKRRTRIRSKRRLAQMPEDRSTNSLYERIGRSLGFIGNSNEAARDKTTRQRRCCLG